MKHYRTYICFGTNSDSKNFNDNLFVPNLQNALLSSLFHRRANEANARRVGHRRTHHKKMCIRYEYILESLKIYTRTICSPQWSHCWQLNNAASDNTQKQNIHHTYNTLCERRTRTEDFHSSYNTMMSTQSFCWRLLIKRFNGFDNK